MIYVAASDTVKKPNVAGYLLRVALRNFVRNRETGVVMVAIVIELLSGLLVATISKLSEIAHALLFDIPYDAHLSANGVISWQRPLLIPVVNSSVPEAPVPWASAMPGAAGAAVSIWSMPQD